MGILDQYIFGQFILMLVISIESAIVFFVPNAFEVDRGIFWFLMSFWILFQVWFVWKCTKTREKEMQKLLVSNPDEIQESKYANKSVGVKSMNIREPSFEYWADRDPKAEIARLKVRLLATGKQE